MGMLAWPERALVFGRMIRFSHTLFALPFALAAAACAARFAPLTLARLTWIVVAMVGARSAAMGFNRIVDRHLDRDNPRTRQRELATGAISVAHAAIFVGVAIGVFGLAAWQLGPLPLRLAPVALAIVLGYSYAKRFTWASQWILGLALAGAPLGAWIAVTGGLALAPVVLGIGVLLWVAGFDTIYACQDYAFDVERGLHSLPARFGIARALQLTRVMHAGAVACLALFGALMVLDWPYWLGVAVVAGTLVHENRLVRADDLSRVDKAFFDLNGIVSVVFLAAVLAARPWEGV